MGTLAIVRNSKGGTSMKFTATIPALATVGPDSNSNSGGRRRRRRRRRIRRRVRRWRGSNT
jgi:hypothetical protein